VTAPPSPPWYANAAIYSLDVRTFQDSDGDGVGDFDGLTARLDYISSLGVTAMWLLPFLPSPYHDGGYDVTNYFDVDERLGGMASFVRFARQARRLGLRFIVDLPLNHTSVDHPWFRAARSDRTSKYHDYYIWVDEPPPNSPEQIVFRGEQPEPWTYDEEAGRYYLHRFYVDEPDLNHANPAVREEVLGIVQFWLELGASGVRIDAAPYIAKKSAADPHVHGPAALLREMHRRARSVRADAVLIAEADVEPDDLRAFVGDGDEMQMLFNFLLNNYFFLALAREEAEPLIQVLGMLPHLPPGAQWANWVRNHDELDLERLSSRDRDDVLRAFAPEDDIRIYGRGIRRRLPPMLDGDSRRIELAYSLLFGLPGTPIIRYGEEIGMGDDLSLPQRNAVRTPMQWIPTGNGGFSTADRCDMVLPVVQDGACGFRVVNVADQQTRRDSLLSRIERFIAVRRQHPEIGCASPTVVDTGDPAVFSLAYRSGSDVTVVAYNLAGEARTVHLEQLDGHEYLFDCLADGDTERIHSDKWSLDLEPYGYRWFIARAPRVSDGGGDGPAAHTATQP
jgi:maltose alpha-D-glucosyltransferase/alpha-amylase